MRQTNTGCYECKYNYNWQCIKVGICTGPVPYETYVPTTSEPSYIPANTSMSEPSYIPANTSIMPDELVINGIKYRRVEDD